MIKHFAGMHRFSSCRLVFLLFVAVVPISIAFGEEPRQLARQAHSEKQKRAEGESQAMVNVEANRDATTGREALTFKGHRGPVLSVVFSPDGKWIVSGSWDTTLKMWDVTSSQETYPRELKSGTLE